VNSLRIVFDAFEVVGDLTEVLFSRCLRCLRVGGACSLALELGLDVGHAKLGHGDADFGPASSVGGFEAVFEVFPVVSVSVVPIEVCLSCS
jgi:hypothetical protein